MMARIARRRSWLVPPALCAMLLAAPLARAEEAPPATPRWTTPTTLFGAPTGGVGTPPEMPAPFVPAEAVLGSTNSRSELKSTGMLAGGVVLTVLGTVGVVAGVAAELAASYVEAQAGCGTPQQFQFIDACGGASTLRDAGIVTLVSSGALLITGVPMIAVGGQTVVRRGSATRSVAPSVVVGPGSARLRVTF